MGLCKNNRLVLGIVLTAIGYIPLVSIAMESLNSIIVSILGLVSYYGILNLGYYLGYNEGISP